MREFRRGVEYAGKVRWCLAAVPDSQVRHGGGCSGCVHGGDRARPLIVDAYVDEPDAGECQEHKECLVGVAATRSAVG